MTHFETNSSSRKKVEQYRLKDYHTYYFSLMEELYLSGEIWNLKMSTSFIIRYYYIFGMIPNEKYQQQESSIIWKTEVSIILLFFIQ